MSDIKKPKYTVAIIGYGYVGKAYHRMFPEAVIYDPYSKEPCLVKGLDNKPRQTTIAEQSSKATVNKCELAIICVPTNGKKDGSLNMSIVEDTVKWLDTPLILIKSALMPGTTDSLIKKYKKRITVSPEYVGEGGYWLPPWKYPDPNNPTMHEFIVIGGEPEDRSEVANYLWAKMSPDIHVHQVTALEAEIVKLVENFWGGLKVVFANEVYGICQAFGADFIQVIKGWGLDSRTDAMHTRTMKGKRGFRSKCYDKDMPALVKAAKDAGYDANFFAEALNSNQRFLDET